jgi:hypothetical protein
MRKLIPLLILAGLLILLFLPFQGTVSAHDIVDIGGGFAESPVPGVRIIRKKHYDKRPAHYLSSDLYTTLAAARETGTGSSRLISRYPLAEGPSRTYMVTSGRFSSSIGGR